MGSTTDNELGCKVLEVTKCWVCCCWVFCWVGWMVRLSTKFRSVCEKGIMGLCWPPGPPLWVSSKADVGVKVAFEVGGFCGFWGCWPTPCKWSWVWKPPVPGPLKSQEVAPPLELPGDIRPDPLDPGDNWPSSKNLKNESIIARLESSCLKIY